jgi:hypothetical protein
MALATLPDTEIEAAMQALPEPFRMVVYYADVEGLEYAQIAEIMDTPKGTVVSRLHRGRRRLRFLLADVETSRPLRRITAYRMHPNRICGLDPRAPRLSKCRVGRLLIANALAGHPPSSPVMGRSN